MSLRSSFRILMGCYLLILLHSGCKKESGSDLLSSEDCQLVQLNDNGTIMDLSYDANGRLQTATTNFAQEFTAHYDGQGKLERISGSSDIRLTHAEGAFPERIEFWDAQGMLYHYTIEEQNEQLTRWSSFPKGATEADQILELVYTDSTLSRIQLSIWNANLGRHQLVLEGDSIHTDGRINPFSQHQMLFVLFMESKPFAFGKENITAVRLKALGGDVPFSSTYTYNAHDLLTSSVVDVQLFGGETTFHYTCD